MTEAKWFGVKKKKKKKIKEIVGVMSLAACSVHADWMAGVLGSHPQQVFVVLSVDAVLFVDTYFTVTSLVTVCASLCLSVRPSVRLCWYCLWLQASRLPLWNLPGGWQGENGHLRSELLRITLSDLFCWPPLYDCAMCCLLSADLIFQFTECKLALCRLWSQCSLCYVL